MRNSLSRAFKRVTVVLVTATFALSSIVAIGYALNAITLQAWAIDSGINSDTEETVNLSECQFNSKRLWLDEDFSTPSFFAYRYKDGVRIELSVGTDYELDGFWYKYDNGSYTAISGEPTEAGRYYVKATGKGTYSGENYIYVTVMDPKNISYWNGSSSDTYWLDEDSGMPSVTIERCKDNEWIELTAGTDYDLDGKWYKLENGSYSVLDGEPTEAGRYYVKATGKGSYTGENYIYVTVGDPKNIAYWNGSRNGTYWLGECFDMPSVNVYRYKEDEYQKLTVGTDYELDGKWYEYDNGSYTAISGEPTEAGRYYVKATGKGTYSGENYIYVTVMDPKNISYWNGSSSGTYWLGEDSGMPSVVVYRYKEDEYQKLTVGTDYDLDGFWYKYDNGSYTVLSGEPTETGTYYVKATGKGTYSGENYIYVTVRDPRDISCWETSSGRTYWLGEASGMPSAALYRYRDGEPQNLSVGTDYELDGKWYKLENGSYTALSGEPTEAGTYYVKAIGKGTYSGENYIYVTVMDPKDISNWSDSTSCFWLGEDSGMSSVDVSRYKDGEWQYLVAGTDYDLDGKWYKLENGSYSVLSGEPTEAGRYYVKATGKGSYTGANYIYVSVMDSKDISSCYADSRDTYWLGEDSDIPSVTVYRYKDGEWQYLTAGTDYELDGKWYERGDWDGYTETYAYAALDGAPTATGTYYVKAIGKGPYTGANYIYVSVMDSKDISSWYADSRDTYWLGEDSDIPSVTFYCYKDGERIELTPSIDYEFDGMWYKKENSSYAVLSGEPVVAGRYYMRAAGKGDYSGEQYVEVTVRDPKNITSWNCAGNDFWLDEEIDITSISICREKDGKRVDLAEGIDYEFDGKWYEDGDGPCFVLEDAPTAAGWYCVKAVGKGSYTGERYIDVFINDPKEISFYSCLAESYWVDKDTDIPVVCVYREKDGQRIGLDEGIDYEICDKWFRGCYALDGEGCWSLDYVPMKGVPADTEHCYFLKVTGIGEYSGSTYVKVNVENTATHVHKLTKTEAKTATATAAGNKEYWACSTCKKLFADDQGETETTLAEVTIPARGGSGSGSGSGGGSSSGGDSSSGGGSSTGGGAAGGGSAQPVQGNQQAADSVVNAIEAIPSTVTVDSKAAVEVARAAYDALTDTQKALVPAEKLAALQAAEQALAKAEQERADEQQKITDQASADAAVAKIDAVGEVTVDSADAVTAARVAYETLTDAQKALVPADKLAALEAAEKALADAQKAAEQEATESQTAMVNGIAYSIEDGEASVATISATTKSVTVAATVQVNGESCKVTTVTKAALKQAKKLQTLTLGKNVTTVQSGALKACKSLKTLVITSKKLTKKSVKNILSGSSVKTVKVKVSSNKKVNKKYVAKYKKFFTKKVCGKKVTVK